MVYINTVEKFALIAKIVIVVLFITLAFVIWRQKRDYVLNKMYFAAFICWTLYIGADAFVFVFLPVSSTLYFVGNRLRDIGVFGVMTMAFLIYKSFEIIKDGQDSINKTRLWIEIAIFTALAIALVLVDYVGVFEAGTNQQVEVAPENLHLYNNDGDLSTHPVVPLVTLLLSTVTFILLIYPIVRLLLLTRNVENRYIKSRMYFLTWGISLIPLGMLYFILMGMTTIYTWWTTGIGYGIWTVAPFLIWRSQVKFREEKTKNSKNKLKVYLTTFFSSNY